MEEGQNKPLEKPPATPPAAPKAKEEKIAYPPKMLEGLKAAGKSEKDILSHRSYDGEKKGEGSYAVVCKDGRKYQFDYSGKYLNPPPKKEEKKDAKSAAAAKK